MNLFFKKPSADTPIDSEISRNWKGWTILEKCNSAILENIIDATKADLNAEDRSAHILAMSKFVKQGNVRNAIIAQLRYPEVSTKKAALNALEKHTELKKDVLALVASFLDDPSSDIALCAANVLKRQKDTAMVRKAVDDERLKPSKNNRETVLRMFNFHD